MSKLKVVHINSLLHGGAARSALRIHDALSLNGVESAFINIETTSSQDSKNIYQETSRLSSNIEIPNFLQRQKNKLIFRVKRHLGFQIKSQLEKKLENKKIIVDQFRHITPLLRCEYSSLPFSPYNILENPIVKDADIIHLHWVAGMIDYEFFFKNNKKPVVWTFHDMNPFQGMFHYHEDEIRNAAISSSLNKKIVFYKRKAIKNRSTKLSIVCPSQWLLNKAKSSDLFNNTQKYLIPYPIDTDVFLPHKVIDLKRSLNIPVINTVFLFVSQQVQNYRKGFDLLIDSLRLIESKDVTLLVIGNAENFDIPELDIRILGTVNEDETLSKYYSIADAFIIPSREDNLPNVLIESLACGTPVLSFDEGGMRETISDGFNGLKAKRTDSHELVKIINQFIQTKNNFKSEKIREFALERFSTHVIAEKYIQVYETLLS